MDAVTINILFKDLINGGISSNDAIKIIISKLEAESRLEVAKLYVNANSAGAVTPKGS